MGYYLRKIGWAFLYLMLTTAIGLGVLFLGEGNVIIKFIASLFSLGLFTTAMCLVFFKEGQRSYQVLCENDLKREKIIQTGKDLPLKRSEEYKPYKGFIIGASVCLLLVVLLAVHTVVALATDGEVRTFGIISGFVYLTFYLPYAVFFNGNVYWYKFLYLLYAVPYCSLVIGFSYYFGAKKKRKQKEEIQAKHEKIYEENKK